MIKVDLITGFLGSGKTTFLKKYAKYLMGKGLKIGILEYDYGAINVDMLLLGELRGSNCELEMLAAACDSDCLQRRFRTKLIAMAMSGYDRVIIEPSGIFDMDMFFDSLREEPLENWYEIGSVITIVSANLETPFDVEANYYLASQAASAGCIVLSKTQLSGLNDIENTKEYIKASAEEIKCNNFKEKYLEKNWDDLTDSDCNMLANCGYYVNDYVKVVAGKESSFSSVSFLNVPKGLEDMEEKLRKLIASDDYGKIIRIKGFISDEKGNFEINITKEKAVITPSNCGKDTIIVIGTDLSEERIREIVMM